MVIRRFKVWAMAIAALGLSSVTCAGSLETNLSGWFMKGEHAEISVTGLGNSGFNFRLSAGNITPEQGCANGPAGCMTLWGWATPTDTPGEYLYANENGQCVFYIVNEPRAIVVRGLKGSCGTNELSRGALKWVEGTYGPLQ